MLVCAQAVWLGDGGPALVRNYDFPLDIVSDYFQSTRWLETCSRVPDAVRALCRIPVALSQNVTVLDKTGAYATVYLAPDRAAGFSLRQLQQAFLRAPLYSRNARSPTVYSAVYRPLELMVDYSWPGHAISQRIGSFTRA